MGIQDGNLPVGICQVVRVDDGRPSLAVGPQFPFGVPEHGCHLLGVVGLAGLHVPDADTRGLGGHVQSVGSLLQSGAGLFAFGQVGQQLGEHGQQLAFSIAKLCLWPHGIQPHKSQAGPSQHDGGGERAEDALYLQRVLDPARRQVMDGRNQQMLAVAVALGPVGCFADGELLQLVDLWGDAGGTPLERVAGGARHQVVVEHIGAVCIEKSAHFSQRRPDGLADLVEWQVDQRDRQPPHHFGVPGLAVQAGFFLLAFGQVGHQPCKQCQHVALGIAKTGALLDGIQPHEPQATPVCHRRHGQQAEDALRCQKVTLVAWWQRIDGRNQHGFAALMGFEPFRHARHRQRLQHVDVRGDAGRTPFQGVAGGASCQVVVEHIGPVCPQERAHFSQCRVERPIDLRRGQVDECRGQALHDGVVRNLPVQRMFGLLLLGDVHTKPQHGQGLTFCIPLDGLEHMQVVKPAIHERQRLEALGDSGTDQRPGIRLHA